MPSDKPMPSSDSAPDQSTIPVGSSMTVRGNYTSEADGYVTVLEDEIVTVLSAAAAGHERSSFKWYVYVTVPDLNGACEGWMPACLLF